MITRSLRLVCLVGLCFSADTVSVQAADAFSFEKQPDRISIKVGDTTVSEYVFAGTDVLRPFLIDVKTIDGIQVTRNHPPQEGDDLDHPHHTGVFFTFGDLNGVDFWHLKGKVVHDRFVVEPRVSDKGIGFATENRYLSLDGKSHYANERRAIYVTLTDHGVEYSFHHLISAAPDGYIRIGSKEEGGLAVRVATPIAISSEAGGRMIDADGRSGGGKIWGQQTDWVDYSGTIDGRHVGILIVPHKKNFARSWWHARDYGLLAANPFGPLNKKGQRYLIRPGETLVLRYHLLVHSSQSADDLDLSAAAEAIRNKQK